MKRKVIWGIVPDENEQPRVEFGENLVTKSAYMSIRGVVQQISDDMDRGFDFSGKNAYVIQYAEELNNMVPCGAIGDFTAAFGGKTSAQGRRAFSAGSSTIAKGDYSHTEGSNTVTLGTSSHAEGAGTMARGDYSHSEGNKTLAFGSASHAENTETKAMGNNSHAGGWKSEAKTNYSFVHGAGAITHTNFESQTVFGQWNLPTQSRLIVGSGSSSNRKNIFEVRANGDICMHYQGKMYSLQKIFAALNKFTEDYEIDLSSEIKY